MRRQTEQVCVEQREQLRLLAVVRAGGIPEGGPDAAKPFRDQFVVRDLRPALVPGAPRDLVQILGERLGESVSERLGHDCLVVVVLRLETRSELVGAESGGYREGAEVIAFRSDVVREAAIWPRVAVIRLLT